MGFAYAVPYVPPAPDVALFKSVALSWEGADGSAWVLTDPASGVGVGRGVRGLGMPVFERHSSSSPAVAGSRHRGSSTMDREVFLPVVVWSDAGSAGFVERDNAFFASFDPDIEGVLTAETLGGVKRSLSLRLTGVDDEFDRDPLQRGWAKYGVNLLADDPYWVGETVRKSWSQGDLRNFYVTADDITANNYPADTIHYLSSGGALGSATFSNDGDVPAYPVWTVIGATTAVSFGVGGADIIVPFAIPDGYAVQLDTDPVNGQVLWYGAWDPVAKAITNPVDRTPELNPASAFVAIPRGQDRPLSIAMTGTGTVIAEVRNRYRRAW